MCPLFFLTFRPSPPPHPFLTLQNLPFDPQSSVYIVQFKERITNTVQTDSSFSMLGEEYSSTDYKIHSPLKTLSRLKETKQAIRRHTLARVARDTLSPALLLAGPSPVHLLCKNA